MVYLVLIMLGLCFGSFVNALVWRIHETAYKQSKKTRKELSILHGRSMCTSCHHVLAWYDLIPVISWASLKGSCRYCRSAISPQYPLVELAVAALFSLAYIAWPYGLEPIGIMLFIFWLIFITGFMALFIYDLRWMLLPNSIVFTLLVLALVQIALHALLEQNYNVIANAAYGFVAVGGLFYVLYQVSGGKWIGGGDVKLGFLLGLLAGGFLEGLMVVFIASLLGTIIAIPLLSMKKQSLTKQIPFGPFLIIALVIVYLYGAAIIEQFQGQFILV
ncbi:prepilin peptidase [Candidatus Saccharibacteria bacterium]|nr:prepilin peptidase [Candidatus Saccharibacteria bacterium]